MSNTTALGCRGSCTILVNQALQRKGSLLKKDFSAVLHKAYFMKIK